MNKRTLYAIIAIIIICVAAVIGYFSIMGIKKPEKITLVMVTHWGDPEQLKIQQKWIEEFQKQHPEVEIRLVTTSFMELRTKIVTMFQAGTPPDIIHIFNAWIPEFVEAGWLAEAPSGLIPWIKENFISSAVEGITYKDKMWGIPTETNTYLLAYRKDHFAEVGLEPAKWDRPWDYDDFLAACEKLIKRDPATGELKRTCFGWWLGEINTGFVHPFAALLVSNGGKLVSPDLSRVTYDSIEGVEVAHLWYTIIKNGWWSPAFPINVGLPYGNVSMFIIAPWWKWNFIPVLGTNFTNYIGVMPIPIGPHNKDGIWRTVSYHWLLAVTSTCKYKDIAWEFAKFITVPRGVNASYIGEYFVKYMGIIPSSKHDLKVLNVMEDPWLGLFAKAAFEENRTIPIPLIPKYEDIMTPLWKNLEQMITTGLEPEVALKSAAEESNRILGR
ncbi:MAG: sugar ABC transporter substrate-binding protein [Nitrososphaerota archaeon]